MFNNRRIEVQNRMILQSVKYMLLLLTTVLHKAVGLLNLQPDLWLNRLFSDDRVAFFQLGTIVFNAFYSQFDRV